MPTQTAAATPSASAVEQQPQDPPGRRGMAKTRKAIATGYSGSSASGAAVASTPVRSTKEPVTPPKVSVTAPEEPVARYIPPHKQGRYKATVEDATDSSESSAATSATVTPPKSTAPKHSPPRRQGSQKATIAKEPVSSELLAPAPASVKELGEHLGVIDSVFMNADWLDSSSAPAFASTSGLPPPLTAHPSSFNPAAPSFTNPATAQAAGSQTPSFCCTLCQTGWKAAPLPPPAPLWHYAIPSTAHPFLPPLPTTPMTLEQAIRLHRIFTSILNCIDAAAQHKLGTIIEELLDQKYTPDTPAWDFALKARRGDVYQYRVLSHVARRCDELVMANNFLCVQDAVEDFSYGCAIPGLPCQRDPLGRWVMTNFASLIYYAATGTAARVAGAAQVSEVFAEWFATLDDGVLGGIVGMGVGKEKVLGWVSVFQNDRQPQIRQNDHHPKRRDPCLCCC